MGVIRALTETSLKGILDTTYENGYYQSTNVLARVPAPKKGSYNGNTVLPTSPLSN